MTENLKKFLEALSSNEELGQKASAASQEELLAMAKELGIELTEDDFKQESKELSDDELDAVAGGKACVCVAGGGGEKDTFNGGRKDIPLDNVCACVVVGTGTYTWKGRKEQRCLCSVGGYGGCS